VVRQRKNTAAGVVQGFDWGGLNSDARFQAAWVFLLPFSLLNAAGWADAPSQDGSRSRLTRVTQLLVLMLGWVLTATVTFWAGDVLVDYAGYQWAPRALGVTADHPATFDVVGKIDLGAARAIGVGVGSTIVAVLLIAALVLAGKAKTASGEPPYNAQSFDGHPNLSDVGFFDRRPSWAGAKLTHLTIAAGALAVVVAQAVAALRSSPVPDRTNVGATLVMVGGTQLVLLFLLGAIGGVAPLLMRRPGAGVAWSLAVVAFALTNAFFSGVVMWVAKYLSTHPDRPGEPSLVFGRELAIVDVFFYVAVAWALIVGAVALHRGRIRGVPKPCSEIAEIPDDKRGQVARAQGTARIMHKIDWLVIALAVVFVVLGIGFGVARAGESAWEAPWRWHLEPPAQAGIAYTVAAWGLPAFVVFVVLRVRKAASDNRLRRFFGQAWDVLAFWPRRFHPFAVRPYSHIAVPELRDRIELLLRDSAVLVSAHSQGTALSVAALASMADLRHVGLVTYGSHVGTLYRRGFPAYFNERQVENLRERLEGETYLQNFYRRTDPIGGPLFHPDDHTIDHCLPDPAATSEPDEPNTPPLEKNREPGTRLAIHSYYLQELMLKRRVLAMKYALAKHQREIAGRGFQPCVQVHKEQGAPAGE
jgi:hypothetical protein